MNEPEHDAKTELRTSVLLSVQRALVGEITPEMRFIEVEFSATLIHIQVFVDGPINEQHRDDFDACAVTQVCADFCFPDIPERPGPEVRLSFTRCDHPTKPSFHGVLVYGRAEIYPD